MATLERTLQGLHRHVRIKTRANIHQLFDANKYGAILPPIEFTFELQDPTRKLEFNSRVARSVWHSVTEEVLRGRILSCEPLGESKRDAGERPRNWRIKVRFSVQFSEHEGENIFHSSTRSVETFINYDALSKQCKLEDKRFYRKFMTWLEPRDENNPGGLFFNGRRIARIAEPKPPWEQNKDLPFGELKCGIGAFNTFGRMFYHGTIGDVAKYLDEHSDEAIRAYPGMGDKRLADMKEELIRLGWKPKK